MISKERETQIKFIDEFSSSLNKFFKYFTMI